MGTLGAQAPNVTTKLASGAARRNGVICALVYALCVLAAYPVSKEGYLDDFSSAHSALIFAQTGRYVYNGWLAPLLGWLVPWGALFIKVFGFSFNVLRISALPIAIGTVYLFHRVLVRFGLSERNALLGTLALALSPLFFPLSISFMTDVPGMFVFLICVAMCQQAADVKSNRAAIIWLVSAALLNALAATVRQNVWLGALVMVPSTGLFLRKRRGALIASLAAAAVSLIGMR